MAYGSDLGLIGDMKDNIKDLKIKMIDMACSSAENNDGLEEYIHHINEILRF